MVFLAQGPPWLSMVVEMNSPMAREFLDTLQAGVHSLLHDQFVLATQEALRYFLSQAKLLGL